MFDSYGKLDQQYFIDQYGKCIFLDTSLFEETPLSIHYEIAAQNFPNILYPKCPQDHAMINLGWIKIGSVAYGIHPITYKNPTQAQLDTLFDLNLLDKLLIHKNGYFVKWKE